MPTLLPVNMAISWAGASFSHHLSHTSICLPFTASQTGSNSGCMSFSPTPAIYSDIQRLAGTELLIQYPHIKIPSPGISGCKCSYCCVYHNMAQWRAGLGAEIHSLCMSLCVLQIVSNVVQCWIRLHNGYHSTTLHNAIVVSRFSAYHPF